MTYEMIQAALTNLITFTAIAGFGGIALHAFWTFHCNWMAEYCPPVAPPTLDAQPLTENLLIEIFLKTEEAIAPYTPEATEVDKALESPDIPSQPEAIAEDIWDSGVRTSAPRYWVRQSQSIKPTLALMPAKEEAKSVAPTRKTVTKKTQQPLDINLNSLDSAALRKLCSKHGINWRDARGKGKHLTKAAMIFQLEQKATA